VGLLSQPVSAEESYSPEVGKTYPNAVYWGDTHVHTSMSSDDAYVWGTRIGPEETYRFARGEAVVASNGMVARLNRPLDFLVIADHAENLGLMVAAERGSADLTQLSAENRDVLTRLVEKIRHLTYSDPRPADVLAVAEALKKGELVKDEAVKRSIWRGVTAAADRYNEPGRFTAFIGYEWSSAASSTPGFGNLHRVIVFKDDASKANRTVPFSKYDSEDPEALWDYLASYERETGGEVLAIPHNGNMSNGDMFAMQTFSGKALTREYAERRQRWEPLYEITQMKGTSEAHPILSPIDEFADFEIWNSWFGKQLPAGREWNDAERERKKGEYARPAWERGLVVQADVGVNPFKFGVVGGTDSHTGLSTAEENNFWGKFPINNPSAHRTSDDVALWTTRAADELFWQSVGLNVKLPLARVLSASGVAAVWATDNTREALFASMKRKETYATTGPRITVRFFGGWGYSAEDALRSDLAQIGYRNGVPMGGDLTRAPLGKAPHFLVRAVKDPDGANLDRIQVIKGWRDTHGEVHEKIYNVAMSEGRASKNSNEVAPVGNTVDISKATYSNSIGSPELATVWTDPEFNAREFAFYYLRVLEIPTPRWTTYDSAFFKVAVPKDVPETIQERAYTSPIWYTP
jgi:hypothetical protein